MKPQEFFNNIERYISALVLFIMLVGLTYNTIARYLFSSSVPWMEEMSAYLMIWLTFMSVGYAVQKNAHLCIDSVTKLYPKKLKPYILLFGQLLLLIFSLVMNVISFQYTLESYRMGGRPVSLNFPMWIIYASIPVGHFFMNIRLIQNMVKSIINIAKGIDENDVLLTTEVGEDFFDDDDSHKEVPNK